MLLTIALYLHRGMVCFCHITFASKLIMLKVGSLYTSEFEWTRAQIDCMLTAVGTRDHL